MSILCYCKKCGRIVQKNTKSNMICDYCTNEVLPIPDEYLHEKCKIMIKPDLKEQFINEYIKSSPEFDQYLFEHRDQDLYNRRRENEVKMAHGKAIREGRDKGNKFGVECPYCHATNVRKITVTSKAAHTAIFGIFSIGRNSKQWHCDHCKSDF